MAGLTMYLAGPGRANEHGNRTWLRVIRCSWPGTMTTS
jgi:hypothetical protein